MRSATEKIKAGACSQMLRGLQIGKSKKLLENNLSLLYTVAADDAYYLQTSASLHPASN